MKKHHYYIPSEFHCAGHAKTEYGQSFINYGLKYCLKTYLKLFKNPNVEVIERAYAKTTK